MTDTATAFDQTAGARTLARAGRWCFVAGLVGVAQGATVLAWPDQVSDGRYSFPFTSTWYVIAQATFFGQHLPLVVAIGVVAGLPAVRRQSTARWALLAAAVGLGLLALTELIAMSAATTANESTLGKTISGLYGVPVLMTGVGLLVTGVVMLRRRILGRALPWTLVVLGAFVFAVLGPVLGTDSLVAGRLAIMAWMLVFAVLGALMSRAEQ